MDLVEPAELALVVWRDDALVARDLRAAALVGVLAWTIGGVCQIFARRHPASDGDVE